MKIKEISQEDYHYIVDWNKGKDKEFLWQWAGSAAYQFPVSEEQIAERIAGGSRIFLVTKKDKPVGTFEMDLNETQNQILISRVLFDEQMRGKGLAAEAISAKLEEIFEGSQLQRAVLHVYAFNVGAMRCYEKIGFRVTQYHQAENAKWNSYTMEYSIHVSKNERRLSMCDCGFTKGNNWFRYRVGAIIIENDCVLFAGNEKENYLYSVGGGVHMGETAKEAVLREVFEETGVHYEIDHLAVIHENFFDGSDGTLKGLSCHEICLYFLMKPRGTQELHSNSTTCAGVREDMHWIPISDLEKYKAFPSFMKDYLEKQHTGIEHIVTDERK